VKQTVTVIRVEDVGIFEVSGWVRIGDDIYRVVDVDRDRSEVKVVRG
jgi:hypothetical protein